MKEHNQMMKNKIALAAAAVIGVVAFGSGSAVAGALIGSADIADNSIQSRDLKDGKAVGTADLKPGLAAKVNAAGQPGEQGPKGDTGAQGPAGPKGDTGPAGAPGTDGLAGAVYRELTYTNGGGGSATVACDDDPAVSQQYTAISGGVQGGTVDTQDDGFAVNSSFPGRMDWDTGLPKAGRLDGWIILGNGEYTSTLTVWALCVPNTSIPVDADTLDN